MARPEQQQIRQDRRAKGLRDPSLLPTDLMLTQPKVRLQLAMHLYHWPPSLIGTYHLTWDPLVRFPGPRNGIHKAPAPGWKTFGPDQAKSHRQAIDVPGSGQEHKANTEIPGVVLHELGYRF